ncbi:hypothetical protein [Sphingopyxis soli]|uniref:hypothetical protein n=1 Tax=Sphingopyxis soli TaxID=592051 RepID=UPI0031BACB92
MGQRRRGAHPRHPGPRSGSAVPASAAFVAEMRALSPQPPAIRIYAAEDITAKLMG